MKNIGLKLLQGYFCKQESSNNLNDCQKGLYHWSWTKFNHRNMELFHDELAQLSVNSSFWKEIKKRLENVTGGERRLLGISNGDFFYIPYHLFHKALPILELLGKYKIFLEIAVASALRPISDEFEIVDTKGHDWGQGTIRAKAFKNAYSTNYEIVHPFKMGIMKEYILEKRKHSSTLPTNSGNACVYCNLVHFSQFSSKS